MFSVLKSWIYAGIIIAVLLAIGMFYFYYAEAKKQELLDEIVVLKANETKYLLAIDQQKETITFLEEQEKRIRENYLATQEAFSRMRKENFALKDRLDKLELEKTAFENPSLIEEAINNVQKNINRCFELEAGADLSEKELSSKSGIELNPECPWVFEERGLK